MTWITLTNRRSTSDALGSVLRVPISRWGNHPTPLAFGAQRRSYDFAPQTVLNDVLAP